MFDHQEVVEICQDLRVSVKTQSYGNLTSECFSVCAVRLVVVCRRFVVKKTGNASEIFRSFPRHNYHTTPHHTTPHHITHHTTPHHITHHITHHTTPPPLLLLFFRSQAEAGLMLVAWLPYILKLSNRPAGSRKLL